MMPWNSSCLRMVPDDPNALLVFNRTRFATLSLVLDFLLQNAIPLKLYLVEKQNHLPNHG